MLPETTPQPAVQRRQVALFGVTRRPSGLAQVPATDQSRVRLHPEFDLLFHFGNPALFQSRAQAA
jgi:hypothetical protein